MKWLLIVTAISMSFQSPDLYSEIKEIAYKQLVLLENRKKRQKKLLFFFYSQQVPTDAS